MNALSKNLILTFLSAAALVSCVSKSYRPQEVTSKRTVIFFLVDGMSASLLTEELRDQRLPQIESYFLEHKRQFHLARTTFPSLTYPAIGALLTEKPVDQSGLYGNRMIKEGQIINFESPRHFPKLNSFIEGQNIFSRLKAKGLRSVSLSHGFYADSDGHVSSVDPNAAAALAVENYEFVDRNLIQKLEALLEDNDPSQWPDFIFVHLVGVDFISHDHGPKSKQARQYLQKLDSRLKATFKMLNRAERQGERQVIAMMSADHGYDETVSKHLDLEASLYQQDNKIRVLNEGRYAAVFFPKDWSSARRTQVLHSYTLHPDIEVTATRDQNSVWVESKTQEVLMSYAAKNCRHGSFGLSVRKTKSGIMQAGSQELLCPDQLTGDLSHLYYPYFLANVSHYFQVQGHPDALIIPRPGVAFKNDYLGQHGGPTAQETLVPLLMRNGSLEPSRGTPALWELLQFVQ